jgi:hypothetical protein
VTPLDVVRVRWQSQGVSQPQSIDFKRLAISTTSLPSTFQPQNLGVTACCREVFFANNTSEACLASPQISGPGAGVTAAECAVEQSQQRTFNSTVDGLRKIARNASSTLQVTSGSDTIPPVPSSAPDFETSMPPLSAAPSLAFSPRHLSAPLSSSEPGYKHSRRLLPLPASLFLRPSKVSRRWLASTVIPRSGVV